MDYDILLDLTTDISYRLAMCGAETFRVEESAKRIMSSYGIDAEVFAIPNCLHISIRTPEGKSLTSMRRIGYHGNDMDGVERYSNLSRRICSERPDVVTMRQWLDETQPERFSFPVVLLGSFLGTAGFSVLFGATWTDALCAGLCGVLIGAISHVLEKFETNSFFRIILAAFAMGLLAYFMGAVGITQNTDAVVIGALLLLMPGLLFVNGLRDIIFGDTNSGMNRVVQVFLIAAAIALGMGAAWKMAEAFWGSFDLAAKDGLPIALQAIACLVGCAGFSVIYNIHGWGATLCIVGGLLAWGTQVFAAYLGCTDYVSYFLATFAAAVYAEVMARIRKFPAISYLVIAIFPLLPGAGVYYVVRFLMIGDSAQAGAKGLWAIAVAGVMAVAILLVSTMVHLWNTARGKV